MVWPIITLTVKIISVKAAKGAVVGLGRYTYRIRARDTRDPTGRPIRGHQKLRHEFKAKDNLIFLILMLSNFFFGLQEFILWMWALAAKRIFNEFWTGEPSSLEDVDALCHRLKDEPWRRIWPELGRWLAIASLIYWPRPAQRGPCITTTPDTRWVELRTGRSVFLIRTDRPRERQYRNMTLSITPQGRVTVATSSGKCEHNSSTLPYPHSDAQSEHPG